MLCAPPVAAVVKREQSFPEWFLLWGAFLLAPGLWPSIKLRMENEEILKEKELSAIARERTTLDQTMLSTVETFEVNGKVLVPSNDIACDVVFLLAA